MPVIHAPVVPPVLIDILDLHVSVSMEQLATDVSVSY